MHGLGRSEVEVAIDMQGQIGFCIVINRKIHKII